MSKVEKEKASLIEGEIEASTEYVQDQPIPWDPSDPSYKNRSKRRDALLSITKAFGQCSWMGLLCSYQEPK